MKKLRVLQNVYHRRAVPGFSLKNLGTVLLVLFFLPYIIASVSGKVLGDDTAVSTATESELVTGSMVVRNQTLLGTEDIPLELYVADKLARTMGQAYEKEALKAQAILIRTNLCRSGDKIISVNDLQYGKSNVTKKHYEAVAETKGMIMKCENKPIYAAYFKSSNGVTRDAKELFEGDQYPYLKSVPCSKDYLAENYHSVVTYGEDRFERLWQLISKVPEERIPGEQKEKTVWENQMGTVLDNAGYVIYFCYKNEWAKGEEVRYMYDLPSASFTVKKEKNKVIFDVKGQGHGVGMSLHSANEMAKEGEDFFQILKYFFADVTFAKVEA